MLLAVADGVGHFTARHLLARVTHEGQHTLNTPGMSRLACPFRARRFDFRMGVFPCTITLSKVIRRTPLHKSRDAPLRERNNPCALPPHMPHSQRHLV